MSLAAWLVLGASLSHLALGIAVWWFRREAQRATAERDRAVADLDAAQTAAAAEVARHQGVARAGDEFFDQYHSAVEILVARHPELSREYVDLVLRLASGPAGPGDPAVPDTTAAHPAAGRPAGDS